MSDTLLHCKVCKELKVRNVKHVIDHAGVSVPEYYPGSKNKKYVDEQGKLWNGRICANCHKQKTGERMKNMRFQQKLKDIEGDGNSST